MLGAEAFFEEYIEESFNTFISHRFEEVVRTYFFHLRAKEENRRNNEYRNVLLR